MNEEMKEIVEQKIQNQFRDLKHNLQETETIQQKKILKIKLKIGTITFLIGLMLSAIFFLIYK